MRTIQESISMQYIYDVNAPKKPTNLSVNSDLLKKGHYTSITRFTKEIVSYSNDAAKLSKNKKAKI